MDKIAYTWNYLGELLEQIDELDEKIKDFIEQIGNGFRPNYAGYITNLNSTEEIIMLFEEIPKVLETLYEQKELSQDSYENKMVGLQIRLENLKELKQSLENCIARFH